MLTSLREYLQSTLGVNEVEILRQEDLLLPLALQQYYHVYVARIQKHEIVFLYSYSENPATPTQIEKHLQTVESSTSRKVCLVFDTITPYMRKKLIERQVPFVVPRKQMFIPFLAIQLQEHFAPTQTNRVKMTPSMQAVILYSLVNKQFEWSIRKAAKVLKYSFVTMSRAFENMILLSLCKKEYRSARTRKMQVFIFCENLWDLALPYLKNPVEKTVFVRSNILMSQTFYSGLTALAHYSMLAEEPTIRTKFKGFSTSVLNQGGATSKLVPIL